MSEMRTEVTKQKMLKRFHTVCSAQGIDQESKRAIVYSYGVESSRDMSANQLSEACNRLQDVKIRTTPDLLRKRLIAAIGGWLSVTGRSGGIDMIKAVACRAARRDSFNDIPREQLNNLYYAFSRMQKDFKAVEGDVKDDLLCMTFQN